MIEKQVYKAKVHCGRKQETRGNGGSKKYVLINEIV
jgi:hypothetical protein